MFFYDDGMGQRQALSCAAPNVFGGKERLKNPRLYIFWYTGAAVLDADLRPVIFASGSNCDLTFSFRPIPDPIGNGMRRINDQVKDYLVELSSKAGHHRQIAGKNGVGIRDVFPFVTRYREGRLNRPVNVDSSFFF